MLRQLFTRIIWELPPDTSRQRKGKDGWSLSSGDCLIKCAKTCACKWFTSIIGICSDIASPLAKDVPTSREPVSPGPRVKATAVSSDLLMPARFTASDTTGIMFC
ncbi:hypothetical protein Barb6_03639 [Bacteroidales bacterium Barb6]|nr:hypothetical protein Barb6_03639 [Bacteroidales bacterium Barb6]OAV72707.1 hypothetical protein Barb7_03060 [Bacteroidales bacterium Barb7]